jgi:anti-sigma factor RsiW
MNSQEAKQILGVYRPNGGDASDGRFSEALKAVEQDAELARWFREQRRFDAVVAEGLKTVVVPPDLKASIIGSHKVVRLPAFRNWRVHAAAAAAVLVLAVAAGLVAKATPGPFPKFRSALIEKAWDGESHLDFESSDVIRVKQWLARQFAPADFTLPEGLRDARLVGCRVVEADGCRVPMLCLADGAKHLHLFVVEGMQFAELPPQSAPDFQKCGAWKTASWQHGDKTYVLTGMSYQTFVSKFRKSGRWKT